MRYTNDVHRGAFIAFQDARWLDIEKGGCTRHFKVRGRERGNKVTNRGRVDKVSAQVAMQLHNISRLMLNRFSEASASLILNARTRIQPPRQVSIRIECPDCTHRLCKTLCNQITKQYQMRTSLVTALFVCSCFRRHQSSFALSAWELAASRHDHELWSDHHPPIRELRELCWIACLEFSSVCSVVLCEFC